MCVPFPRDALGVHWLQVVYLFFLWMTEFKTRNVWQGGLGGTRQIFGQLCLLGEDLAMARQGMPFWSHPSCVLPNEKTVVTGAVGFPACYFFAFLDLLQFSLT